MLLEHFKVTTFHLKTLLAGVRWEQKTTIAAGLLAPSRAEKTAPTLGAEGGGGES